MLCDDSALSDEQELSSLDTITQPLRQHTVGLCSPVGSFLSFHRDQEVYASSVNTVSPEGEVRLTASVSPSERTDDWLQTNFLV